MIIHLLRHGEVYNPDNVIYERLPNFHLSKNGEIMAKNAADYIVKNAKMSQISQIYSSPLLRATQTAQAAKNALKLNDITLNDNLIEVASKFAGKNIKFYVKQLLKSGKILQIICLFYNPFLPSWGEPYSNIARRMKKTLLELAMKHQNQNILVVSHQSPIWIARRVFSNKSPIHNPSNRDCDLCSITSIEFDDQTLKVIGIEYHTTNSVIDKNKG